MKYRGKFEFYTTFVEGVTNEVPITIPYNLTPAKRKALHNHNSFRFIHSGNWWSIKNPKDRSKESILEQQLEMFNADDFALSGDGAEKRNESGQ